MSRSLRSGGRFAQGCGIAAAFFKCPSPLAPVKARCVMRGISSCSLFANFYTRLHDVSKNRQNVDASQLFIQRSGTAFVVLRSDFDQLASGRAK